MALYSIAQNSVDARIINSSSGIGASLYVKADTKALSEKRDQSTFPDFYINENTELVVRGPKNIIRTACEFAVENRNRVNVYVGSPVEIAATLYNLSLKQSTMSSVFNDPDNNTKLVDLVGFSSDVHDFKEYAAQIGILLSKRTARRIMDGDIKPQESILERISNKGISSKSNRVLSNNSNNHNAPFDVFDIKNIYKAKPKRKSIKIDKEDRDRIKTAIEDEFMDIAEKYYLKKDINPKVNLKNNKMTISFDIVESDF